MKCAPPSQRLVEHSAVLFLHALDLPQLALPHVFVSQILLPYVPRQSFRCHFLYELCCWAVRLRCCIFPVVSLPCLLAVGCWTHRQEADSQAASLRSQGSAREERLQAQFASRLAQLQSELDARCAAAADREGALAAAKDEISRLAIQVGTISREQGVAWSGQASWYKCSID